MAVNRNGISMIVNDPDVNPLVVTGVQDGSESKSNIDDFKRSCC